MTTTPEDRRPPLDTALALPDGLLTAYLSEAKMSDANVEKRPAHEPFDYRTLLSFWQRQKGDEVNGRRDKARDRGGKIGALVFAAALAGAMVGGDVHAKIIPENWKPCADASNGVVYERTTNFDGKPIVLTRFQIPAWTRAPAIRPYYGDDPLLLANHGLCNAKFHRVVLCLPGWQESDNKGAPWFKVCAAYELTR